MTIGKQMTIPTQFDPYPAKLYSRSFFPPSSQGRIFIQPSRDIYPPDQYPSYGGLLGFIHGGTDVHVYNF